MRSPGSWSRNRHPADTKCCHLENGQTASQLYGLYVAKIFHFYTLASHNLSYMPQNLHRLHSSASGGAFIPGIKQYFCPDDGHVCLKLKKGQLLITQQLDILIYFSSFGVQIVQKHTKKCSLHDDLHVLCPHTECNIYSLHKAAMRSFLCKCNLLLLVTQQTEGKTSCEVSKTQGLQCLLGLLSFHSKSAKHTSFF